VRRVRCLCKAMSQFGRLQGRNARADRVRLAQLFAQSPQAPGWAGSITPSPQLPRQADGSTDVDFLLRTTLLLPVDGSAAWRPLSERAIDGLADALNAAPIHVEMTRWTSELRLSDIRHSDDGASIAPGMRDSPGRPLRRASSTTLPRQSLWRHFGDGALTCGLDMIFRLRAFVEATSPTSSSTWRLTLPDLYRAATALIQTFTNEPFVRALAVLASVDPIVVPQPELDQENGVGSVAGL
jgi:hypothetical protein